MKSTKQVISKFFCKESKKVLKENPSLMNDFIRMAEKIREESRLNSLLKISEIKLTFLKMGYTLKHN